MLDTLLIEKFRIKYRKRGWKLLASEVQVHGINNKWDPTFCYFESFACIVCLFKSSVKPGMAEPFKMGSPMTVRNLDSMILNLCVAYEKAIRFAEVSRNGQVWELSHPHSRGLFVASHLWSRGSKTTNCVWCATRLICLFLPNRAERLFDWFLIIAVVKLPPRRAAKLGKLGFLHINM